MTYLTFEHSCRPNISIHSRQTSLICSYLSINLSIYLFSCLAVLEIFVFVSCESLKQQYHVIILHL